jgi:dihydroxy-acid dehydratase
MMGALSMGLPMIYFPAGAMLRGNWNGNVLGSGTDAWKYWAELRAGNITEEDWEGVESGIARSPGTCMTMGTAATMMSAMEALGFTLPGASSIPAVDSRHAAMATSTGRRIVDMVWEDLKPSQVISAAAVDNAITAVLSMAGSTNAVVHLLAIARRAGIPLKLDRFDELARRVPVLANMRPAGKYLMEDFYYAGGLTALLKELGDLLDTSVMTVNGATLGENIADAKIFNTDVIHTRESPMVKSDALVVLRGNLAPDGAVMKPPAAEAQLLKHKGPAVVFDSYEEMKKRMDDPNLAADENSVFILRNAGPKGGPGMPEWGQLPCRRSCCRRACATSCASPIRA